MDIKVENISKSYNGQPVLKSISFEIERGEIASLVGPSGVGKTTLLSIIAGLTTTDSGRIVFEKQPSKAYPVILVFQDYTLFPNLTVFENVAFGLRARHRPRKEIRDKVSDMIEYFGLIPHAKHYPAELSAGQKQRVAIARAMVIEPCLLLLDEPFANLDRNLKMDTAWFIRNTQKQFGITTISVTHDLEEAFTMSDKIGIMIDGRLEQYDTVAEVYHRPRTLNAASFLGPVNRIPPELFSALGVNGAASNGDVIFARPEGIGLEPDESGPAVIEDVVFVGHYIVYHVRLSGVRFTVYSLSDGLKPGSRVRLKLIRYLKSRDDHPHQSLAPRE